MERVSYTVAEAAEMLGVSAQSVRKGIRIKEIPTCPLSIRTLIPAQWLQAMARAKNGNTMAETVTA